MTQETEITKKCDSGDYSKDARKFYIVLSLSIAAIIIAESALVNLPFATWIKVALALAHVPFTILVAVKGWKVLMGMDELQRQVHMQSFVFGITAAAVYMLTGNLLYEAGIGNGIITWMFWPMLWVFYSLRYSWLKKSYR